MYHEKCDKILFMYNIHSTASLTNCEAQVAHHNAPARTYISELPAHIIQPYTIRTYIRLQGTS